MSADQRVDSQGGLASAWRTITLWGLALAAALVLTGIVLSLSELNRQRDRALAAQRHSYDVMILARTLQGTIARAEAAVGRYVISGDQQLGRLYYEDWRRANGTIERLDKLTSDDGVQARHLRELRSGFQERGDELALIALNTNYGKNSQALARFYQGRNAPSLEKITATLLALIADERTMLERRNAQAQVSVRRSTTIAKILAVFGVLLVIGTIALGWAMFAAQADRAIAHAETERERERADELAEAVARATEELRVQEARLRQIQKMQAVGQLTGGIAHDFNNMLSVTMAGIELAQRSLSIGRNDAARHLDTAYEGVNRAAALTRQLLAFARETAINPETIGAAALFASIDDLIARTLGDGITIVFDDRSDGWYTRVDRVQLENSIVNLAVNARDAMDGRGTLTVTAGRATLADAADEGRVAGEFLTLSVTDTGCGIDAALLERVFEPFFTTKPVGKGTGLGLSQIFSFARQVGGDVTIRSAPGEGTAVTLFLPRDHGSKVVEAPARLAETSAAPVVAEALALTILVVEDDPRVLPATMEALEELGHHPTACADPQQVHAILAGMERIDLILSDVLMPGLTGPEMIAALPAPHRQVPVLFVTGFAGEAGSAGDLGGHPVLRKPFTLTALAQAVSTAAAAVPRDHPAPLAAE